MLNAATATISDRTKNSMRLVIEMERKKFVGPILDLQVAAHGQGGGARNSRRGIHVGEAQANTRDVVGHAQQLRGVLHGDDGDPPVVLIHADGEDAGHVECAHSRDHADRRDVAQGDEQHHAIADLCAEFLGQRRAQYHAVPARDEIAHAAARQMRLQVDDAPFRLRNDPAQHHAG
jgi:hypothetical protein